MNQRYFILVLAHSVHGRLRRVHIPQRVVYGVLALALLGCFSLFGIVSSYVRMAWKVADYNSLRSEFNTLRARYQNLQNSANQTKEQLATLQVFATEVSIAYGIKQKLEGTTDISSEGRLIPTFSESLAEYNFLKGASLSKLRRRYPSYWQTNVRPDMWPVNGRLMSQFGRRSDPFSGEWLFHSGVDISAATGTPVQATADGVVVHAEYSGAYGKLVIVDHGSLQTYYAHLSRIDVVEGQEIRRGEIVGGAGATGRATSSHVHYEVRQNRTPVNPYPYLKTMVAQEFKEEDLPF